MRRREPVTYTRIFWFWIPLAAMWLMMAIEQPSVAAVIARLPDPELNLAAFGVTYSLALMVESPIIMLLTAGTALPKGPQSYRRLLNFTHILSVGLTALHLVVGLTPLYSFIVGRLIGAPPEIIEPGRQAFLLMIPWTAAVAYRRLWQGVLIRYDRTSVVPLTMGSRLAVSVVILTVGLLTRALPGASVGALALGVGVITAAVAAYGFARSTVAEHLSQPTPHDEPLAWRELLEFYVPLALTSAITLLGRPVLSVGLARAPEPLASLAVWPVITGFLFLGRSFALSYQESVVALLEERESFDRLRRFTVGLAVVLGVVFAGVALTPGARLWFETVSGLSPRLAAFAITPTIVLAVVPGVSTLISWQRGLLVHVKRTPTITRAVVINLVVLAGVMLGAVALLPTAGATMAALALAASVTAEWLFLWWRSRGVLHHAHITPASEVPVPLIDH